MKANATNEGIVEGGGWGDATQRYQPRARLFTMLAVLWVFPSAGAGVIIGGDFIRWFQSPTVLAGVQAVAFEQWIALGLLMLHVLFVALAIWFHRREPIKEVIVRVQNPEADLNN